MRRHKIKQESATTSSHLREEEHDLAHYIHDRVELMHQVFSVIKPKELKAMAPNCVQLISIDNLQELCTEELLGISSKRLCAILDGADPPTDTESSSSEQLETISLDSISSDDEILSQPASKKKHKHRKRNKAKNRTKHSSESEEDKGTKEKSKANRAGLTVLELLELQARARAIRAQLQKDNASKAEEEPAGEKEHSSDEVEIKEEPPEVFEISSDDEKPKLEELQKLLEKPSSSVEKASDKRTVTKTVTKVVNDLTITVPTKPTHKIRLNRNRSVKTITSEVKDANECVKDNAINKDDTRKVTKDKNETKDKPKKKRKKNKNKDGSDHDEITLQLSDTEKMDLLEDLDRKNFDNFTSSESSDNSSCENGTGNVPTAKQDDGEVSNSAEIITKISVCVNKVTDEIEENNEKEYNEGNKEVTRDIAKANNVTSEKNMFEGNKEETLSEPVNKECTDKDQGIKESEENLNTNEQMEDGEIKSNKDLSEGEISDKDAIKESEKEIVCISDDEKKTQKKKKKKEKKSKKEKKKKIEDKQTDFRESGDQNFFEENNANLKEVTKTQNEKQTEHADIVIVDENFDADLSEVLELSDSDYEIDIIVSQEPTADEIKALSAKIDEINPNEPTDMGEVESWRDRYLHSKKVKKVLTTANLLNALRKKNKELKNKLEVKPQIIETEKIAEENDISFDGTIEQFNALQGSTKYVDPVVEDKKKDEEVTKEMKKDAKQLLKMYKMLLKYNDINKHKDPNRKKKKKQKKCKEKKDIVDNKCVGGK